MLWLTGYYDACGHHDGKHVLALGGYISSVPAWLRFEKQWKRALKRAGIDVPFHMTDFMACERHFKNWKGREEEQAELLLKLSRHRHLQSHEGLSSGRALRVAVADTPCRRVDRLEYR